MAWRVAQVHTWKLGYYLFWNLRNPRRTMPGLSRADVYAVARRIQMPAHSAWMLMDHNGDQRVTMDEVVRSVEQVYNNRTILARSLAESQTVVGQVQNIIHAFLLVVLAFVTVAIVIPGGIAKVWTSMSAGLLSFSFIFGNSICEIFENCVFLFFTHPFDLGDKIRWNGETYFVRGITLNYVNLLHASGSYVNLSAHILKDAAITNVTRSQRVWESIHFVADINTTVKQCEIAADKVVEAISTHPRLFGGMYRVWLSDTDSANKIKISAHFDLKTNGMDASMMGEAMTVMTAAFADGLCEAGVSYTDLALACPTCWPKRGDKGCGDGASGQGLDAFKS
jgi:small-conductance mechanosensitive channel